MKEKFTNETGRARLVEAILEQRFVEGNRELAEDIASQLDLVEYESGSVLIEQNAHDDDLVMILAGTVHVLINGKHMATRHAGQTVGEMSAVNPLQKRSATVVAAEPVLTGRVSEGTLTKLADGCPRLWRFFAKDLARRLLERNKHVGAPRENVEIFIISSVESLPIARAIQTALEHDPYNVIVWTDGVSEPGSTRWRASRLRWPQQISRLRSPSRTKRYPPVTPWFERPGTMSSSSLATSWAGWEGSAPRPIRTPRRRGRAAFGSQRGDDNPLQGGDGRQVFRFGHGTGLQSLAGIGHRLRSAR